MGQGLPATVRVPPGLSHNPPHTERDFTWPRNQGSAQAGTDQPGAAVLDRWAGSPLSNEFRSRTGSLQRCQRTLRTDAERNAGDPRRGGAATCAPQRASTALLSTGTAHPTHRPSPTCSSVPGRRDIFLCRLRFSPETERTSGPAGEWSVTECLHCHSEAALLQHCFQTCHPGHRGGAHVQRDAHLLLALTPSGASQEPYPHPPS